MRLQNTQTSERAHTHTHTRLLGCLRGATDFLSYSSIVQRQQLNSTFKLNQELLKIHEALLPP